MSAPECLTELGAACYADNNIGNTHPSSNTFHGGDWAVLAVVLSISAVVGIYWAWTDRNKSSAEYMMGGGNVSPLPIAMSLATTSFSAITILGTPTEYYRYGTMFLYFSASFLICTVLSAEFFAPMYMDFKFTSTYEYMEKRFHRSVRVMATLVYVVQNIIYVGMIIYAPALALETVTGLGKWASVWSTGLICIFYTSIGGVKAVVWTDTIQLSIMLSGFVAIATKGLIDFGFDDIHDVFRQGKRNVWGDFMFDPRYRHTFWSIVLGGVFGTSGNGWCASQSMVQRMLTCRSKRDMRIALYSSFVLIFTIQIFAALVGMVLFRYNSCCDPLRANYIDNSDQLVPYLALIVFSDFPGVAGLYISGAYSGSLSSVSSGINSMATVIITDFIKPNEESLSKFFKFNLTEKFYLWFGKISSIIIGLLAIGFAHIVSDMGGILQASMSISNIVGGANFALYLMAFLNPYANRWGAHFGFIFGLAFSTWIYVGNQEYPTPAFFTKRLPNEVVGCANITSEEWCPPEIDLDYDQGVPGVANLYWISYMYLGTAGFVMCLFTGTIISWLTGSQDPHDLPQHVLLPLLDKQYERRVKEEAEEKTDTDSVDNTAL